MTRRHKRNRKNQKNRSQQTKARLSIEKPRTATTDDRITRCQPGRWHVNDPRAWQFEYDHVND